MEDRSSGVGIEDKQKVGAGDVGDRTKQQDEDLPTAQVF